MPLTEELPIDEKQAQSLVIHMASCKYRWLTSTSGQEKLSEALKNVQESELQKEEFSSMMTHELNTPLVPIKGYCEMLKDVDTFGTRVDFIRPDYAGVTVEVDAADTIV